jgi:Na+/melibiose symporter-like transporter
MTPVDPSLPPTESDARSARLWAALRDRTFRSLRHRDYRLYFFGQLVSFVGSWTQSTALMWLVYDLTNDPIWPALLLVALVGPTLLLAPAGGALADRVPKRTLVLVTQVCFLATALALTATVGFGYATPAVLFAIQLANGCVQAVDLPARLSFVPDLVPKEDLINAVSLGAMLFNSARFVGPALTGLIFLLAGTVDFGGRPVAAGAAVCFALNAVSFAAVLVALTRISVGGTRANGAGGRTSAWDGMSFLIVNPPLGGLVALTGCLCVFTWPVITLLPSFTRTVLGLEEKAFSGFVSSLGFGALLAAFTAATFGSVRRRRRFLRVGAVVAALGVGGLSVSTAPAAAALSCTALGCGLILYLSTGQSTLQLNAPDAARGRVMALWAMTLSASAPLGHLVAGRCAQVWPVPTVLTVMFAGAAISAAGIVALASGKGLKA